MKRVYLAGLINPNVPRSIEWRDDAADRLEEHFEVINPMRGKYLKDDPEFYASEGQYATSIDENRIVARDYYDVSHSDYLLCNLDSYDSPRPLTGTLFELAWAWQLGKPVVVFVEPGHPGSMGTLLEHPFIKRTITEHHYNLDHALYALLSYYA